MKEFDEAVFNFVRKMMPKLKTSNFQNIRNELVIIPKYNIYPMMGNKGNNTPFDDYSERHYYSIGLKSNGYYKIIEITDIYYHFTNAKSTSIKDVNCNEFSEKLEHIKYDLSMLFNEPKQYPKEPIKESEINYCRKVIDQIT